MDIKLKDIYRLPCLVTLSLFILLSICTANVRGDESCGSENIEFAGYTRPKGDIYIEYGKPLEIICVVNNYPDYTYIPSDYLYFEKYGERVPENMIEVINETSIRLYDPQPEIQSKLYSCKLGRPSPSKTTGVCINQVIVGTKPSQVTDFRCQSLNWVNMTCTWTNEVNTAKVTYDLKYQFKPARRSPITTCAHIYSEGSTKNCFWNKSTAPIYRLSQETFNFTLNATNYFGTSMTTILFNHFANVKPSKPTDLKPLNATPKSIMLYWERPSAMGVFPKGLEHRLAYQCRLDKNKEWKVIKLDRERYLHHKKVHYNLTNLQHAHDTCDIRVSLRSGSATTEEMWSANASITAITLSEAPDYPPRTTIGSFQLVDSGTLSDREVNIYWQQIPEADKNGESFHYRVEVHPEDSHKSVPSPEMYSSYAKFYKLSKNQAYRFAVWAENINGSSPYKSYIYIPADGDRPKEPRVDPKVAYGSGSYELSWKPGENNHVEITNYTVFWCSFDKERPYQCDGILNWTDVPSTKTSFNITVQEKKITQFAIAANSRQGSSGMVWVPCTIIHNETRGRMKKVWIDRIGSTFIELGWSIECNDGIVGVKGYIIYYCPVRDMEKNCITEPMNTTLEGDAKMNRGNITNLIPYTTYRLSIAARMAHKTFTEQSDILYNTTLEDAPSRIPRLVVKEISNSTILIEWDKPVHNNGHINRYSINVIPKSNPMSVTHFNCTPAERTYLLTNLSGFEVYTIEVQACTNHCSEPANTTAKTLIGRPSTIPKPHVRADNFSSILTWSKPSSPRGRNDFFQVKITEEFNTENMTNHIITLNGTETQWLLDSFCQQEGKGNKLFISVRAVNRFNNSDYQGDWSEELEYLCNATSNYLLLIIGGVILGLAVIIFLLIKCYQRCGEMSRVEVKIPAGLQLPPKESFSGWGVPGASEDPPRNPAADEEHLLEKLTDARLSGDSSGCSSGHDSVTSLESGTNMSSSSDSGTEQPRSPGDKNCIRRRKADSRINVSKPYVSQDAMPNWNTTPLVTPSPPAAGAYCMLGVNPITQKEPETNVPIVPIVPAALKGYVTMPTNGLSHPSWNPKTPPNAGNYCMLGINPEAPSKSYVTVPGPDIPKSWEAHATSDTY